jgi:hypothetical protein
MTCASTTNPRRNTIMQAALTATSKHVTYVTSSLAIGPAPRVGAGLLSP